jgi:choline dehydrogenase-like flavoprotein
MAVVTRPKVYDVCIVGSGAGGGMAAKVLTEAGADCVMLEAGPKWSVEESGTMFKWNHESPRRGAGHRGRPFGEFDACLGGWDIPGEPYTVAEDSEFLWFRGRMLGGRTNHWGRIALRFGPWDFKGRSRDGLGDDWPIGYEDVKPYYDRLDELVGLFGSNEGLENDPDGIFLPPPAPRAYERLVKKACDHLKVTCIPSRIAILTKPHGGRAACHYCSQCARGCNSHSYFTTPTVLLPPALATGRLALRTGAMVREVTTNDEGLCTGATYVDTATGQYEHVRAKAVVLAASACESARILLNSKSPRFPNGLANGSGAVGRHLTDSTGSSVRGHIPALESLPPHNEDGTGNMHLYMPWWGDNKKLDFPRGYHIEFGGGRRMPGYGFAGRIDKVNGGGYGQALKDDYRRFYGAGVSFAGRGEMIPNEHSYCEVDPETVDRWGIPVLRFHWKWSEHEILQVKHQQETFRDIIETMGGKISDPLPGPELGYGISKGGEIIHEVGTIRMGDNPRTSVLNRYGQAHETKNLFVADGGSFVSNAHKNVTWTILALAWRTSEYLADERKKGNLS